MKIRESDYRASQKYLREKCKDITLRLNKKYDEDIIVWIDSQGNKNGYLKDLIRADMERNGFRLPEKVEE